MSAHAQLLIAAGGVGGLRSLPRGTICDSLRLRPPSSVWGSGLAQSPHPKPRTPARPQSL
eukprot:CAMPEP_0179877332 /NCGR_PEP_ID=MMETSP0982-20121206/24739_1 /TAXON_ID=483367 /ORGANISM="non described non described, Strain CCMP 2436" /LENGTH=59 /DNA_ID=CAMNT_0021769935 /DNA_START=614 /DNA_END=793 /DNA_ORIENTATION=+